MNLKRTRNFIENEIDKDIMSSENGVNTPAPNPSPNSSFSLLSVLGRERLTGPQLDEIWDVKPLVLSYENKKYVLDCCKFPIIDNDSPKRLKLTIHQMCKQVSYIMAASMSPELQKTFKNTWAYEMNQRKRCFRQRQARNALML
ncbi:hypothetical protein Tco_0407885 [Tanacetum coccineum]